jgi:hypothetical protein
VSVDHALVRLRQKVDDHFEGARARNPDQFACRSGCSSCCQAGFGVFELEAADIRKHLAVLREANPELRQRIRAQATDPTRERCALLVDDRCSVYEVRPIICRSMGLPVLAAGRIDVCPLNFVDVEPPRSTVVRLEAIDTPLALMAELAGAASRVPLVDLARGD